MSSNSSRVKTIFRAKTSKALDKMEDPRDTLDDSYDQQVKLLQQVRQAVAEVATAKKRIELQGQEMGSRYQRLGSQAGEAFVQGREDLARAALERRALLEGQVAKLQQQFSSLDRQSAQLQERERILTEQVGAFRIEKETIKATYTASEAQVKANEAVSGLSNTITEVGSSLDRARDRVAQMQARAAATDELLASGALTDLTAAPDADIERQLAAVSAKADVDRQLQAMKGGVAASWRDRSGVTGARTDGRASGEAGAGRGSGARDPARRPYASGGRARIRSRWSSTPSDGAPSRRSVSAGCPLAGRRDRRGSCRHVQLRRRAPGCGSSRFVSLTKSSSAIVAVRPPGGDALEHLDLTGAEARPGCPHPVEQSRGDRPARGRVSSVRPRAHARRGARGSGASFSR